MRFGTYHVFQCPPWMTQEQVFREELERVDLSEALGYDSVWVPEQHFYPYCLCGDALAMAAHIMQIRMIYMEFCAADFIYIRHTHLSSLSILVYP